MHYRTFHSNYGPLDCLILFDGAPVTVMLDEHDQVLGIAWLAGARSRAVRSKLIWEIPA